MKQVFLFLGLAFSTLSCRQAKALVAQANDFFRLIIYEMEALPASKYQALVVYPDEQGKLDSVLTAKPWRYEFKARPGTVVRAKIVARPLDPAETAPGMVRFKIYVDGALVNNSVSRRIEIEHKVE